MKHFIFVYFAVFNLAQILQGAKFDTLNEIDGSIATELQENLTSLSYDEHLLQDIERHLKVVNLENELLSKKVDEIHNQLNDLLTKKSINNENFYKKPKNCLEALSDPAAPNGVYQISVPNQNEIKPFYAFCMRHPETNEAWTLIQRRMNGKIDFYRNWHDYEYGFGDLSGEHWLGLAKIHDLTNERPHKLWIELGDFENYTHAAYYEQFAIGDEQTDYSLQVLGNYSGNAGDSLTWHAGHKFATKNKDDKGDCAKERKGGWWFNFCTESHLNGEYLSGSYSNSNQYGLGVSWYGWHGRYYSLKYAHMAIRPID